MLSDDFKVPMLAIRRMYNAMPPEVGVSFHYDVDQYMKHGYVYSGRDLFVMARLCNHNATPGELENMELYWPAEETDCWHVQAAAGDLSRIFDICPVALPYARWVNRGRQFIVPMEKARKLLTSRRNGVISVAG